MNRKTVFALFLIALAFLVSAHFFPLFSPTIASHWNAQGEADGFSSKTMALFLVPGLMIALFLLFQWIPTIDPLKKNISEFRKYYDNFVLLFVVFMLYLHLLSVAWNLQIRFNMLQALSPAFAALFYYAGILIQHAKPNWFIGIRTPWTMSSETVWKKTHQLGGKLFKASGIIALFGIILPQAAIGFILAPAILTAIFTVVFSYREFQKEKKRKN